MSTNRRYTVLAVDDEQGILHAIQRILRRDYEVILSSSPLSALEVIRKQPVAVLLVDQRMPEMTGVEFLRQARDIQPDAVRILITGYSDIDATIRAINEGQIFYYIQKPWEPDELRLIVRRAIEHYQLKKDNERLLEELRQANERLAAENLLLQREMEAEYTFDHIIGKSPAMQKVFHLLKKVIPTDVTVLITGETGTGKELVARAIHYNGPRKHKMFVSQNCASLPETLLESELFGHVKGAFTGATRDKKGLFELADGGTIFLDEIGETSPEFQKRLLRVLQEGEIHPVGSEKAIHVNVRVISATNRDLARAVQEGKFREDLFYRLNVFPIHLPPLRERREDIPELVYHFIRKYSLKMGKRITGIHPEALQRLRDYDYPGNVRQLENIIERAIVLADDGMAITPDLIEFPEIHTTDGAPFNGQGALQLKERVEQMERYFIERALQKNRGNISQTARELGLSRMGLHKKLQRYRIDLAKYKLD
ncbi:MAG: sigma-54-dependent Fis family transcriptional regulator [Calditrichaeota bacterium]|nr:sigma-54-dependent Fis family transcriptional regulator [Calditrichota bacterium]